MNHHRIGLVFAFVWLMTSTATAQATQCAEGRVANALSTGHCCWPGQHWNEELDRCAGAPRCPRGWAGEGSGCVRLSTGEPADAPAAATPAAQAPMSAPIQPVAEAPQVSTPPANAVNSAYPVTATTMAGDTPGAGGAIGGGIAMLLSGGLVMGLAAASESTRSQLVPSLPIGLAAIGVFALATPIFSRVMTRNREARHVDGVGPLRIIGWVGYPLSILNALTLVLYAPLRLTPVPGHILSVGILGLISMAALAIDGFVSAGQERSVVRATRSTPRRSGFTAMPTASVAANGNDSPTFTFGLAGVF